MGLGGSGSGGQRGESLVCWEERAKSAPNSACKGYDNGYIAAGDKMKEQS